MTRLDSLRQFVERDAREGVAFVRVLAEHEFDGQDVVVYDLLKRGEDGETFAEFLVAGDLPYVGFNKDEIVHPEEALLLWAWFVSLWISKSGKRLPLGDLPILCRPDSNVPLDIFTEDMAWLLKRFNNVMYGVLPHLRGRIVHPELIERYRRLGIPLPTV